MTHVALNFHGPINAPATIRLRNAICATANGSQAGPCDKLILLLSSWGGSLEDGFSLYNLIRSIKTEVVTVNMGQIASIANVFFLGGSRRIACEHSYFHFHDFDWTFTAPHTMTRDNLADTSQLLEIARKNKKALFKERTSLTDEDFDTHKFLDSPIIRDTAFAKAKGIIHEIGLPDLTGVKVFNIDY